MSLYRCCFSKSWWWSLWCILEVEWGITPTPTAVLSYPCYWTRGTRGTRGRGWMPLGQWLPIPQTWVPPIFHTRRKEGSRWLSDLPEVLLRSSPGCPSDTHVLPTTLLPRLWLVGSLEGPPEGPAWCLAHQAETSRLLIPGTSSASPGIYRGGVSIRV